MLVAGRELPYKQRGKTGTPGWDAGLIWSFAKICLYSVALGYSYKLNEIFKII